MSIKLLSVAAVIALAVQGDGVIRLKPSDFRQLPSAVRRNLDKRGCSIPQFPGKSAPHNVITGSFIAKGSRDWAVLCSIKGTSRILVYRNGGVKTVDSAGVQDDGVFLQRNASGVFEFSRVIEIAPPKRIADAARELETAKPPTLDHDGIEDGYVDKASALRYYYRGKWRELQGAD